MSFKNDLMQTLGLDDRDYQQGMDRVEGRTSAAMGRIGKQVEARTAGFRRFSGAISGSVGAVTALLGVVGAAAGVFTLVRDATVRLASANTDTVDTVDRLAESYQRAASAVRSFRGFGRSQSASDASAANALQALAKERAELHAERQRLRDNRGRGGDLGVINDRIARNEQQTGEVMRRRDRFREMEQAQQRIDAQRDVRRLEIEHMRARGQDEAAALAAEQLRFETERNAKLAAVAGERDAAREIMRITQEVHERRMENIRREHAARRAAAADALEAQQRGAQFASRMGGMGLAAQLAAARGNGDEARRLQAEMQFAQNVRSIMGDRTLSHEERMRRVRQAQELMQLQAAGPQSSGPARTRMASGGLLASDVFAVRPGRSDEARTATATERTAEAASAMRQIVMDIGKAMRGGFPAVFA